MAASYLRTTKAKRWLIPAAATAVLLFVWVLTHPLLALAATGGCTPPATDYGTVSGLTVTTTAPTTDIWSRVAIPDTTNNNYLLEIDDSSNNALDCYTVTASSGAVYVAGTTTYFNNDSSNWVNTTVPSSGTGSLPAGTYHVKLIGNAPNVVVDRLIFASDNTCTPTGTGDNCTSSDTTPPAGSITSPANGTQVSGTVAVSVSASDNIGVTGVSIYDSSTKLGDAALTSGNAMSGTWTYNWDTSGLAAGSSHTLTAHVTDGPNPVTTTSVTVTIKNTYLPADINEDGHINYLDLSALASQYNKSGAAITIPRADINGDGTVNYLDLSALASKYNSE